MKRELERIPDSEKCGESRYALATKGAPSLFWTTVASSSTPIRDFRSAGLSKRDVEMLAYAETISKDASPITHEHIEPLRSVGFTDVQICDIALCVAFRYFVARLFDATGAGPEPAFFDADANFRSAMTVGKEI